MAIGHERIAPTCSYPLNERDFIISPLHWLVMERSRAWPDLRSQTPKIRDTQIVDLLGTLSSSEKLNHSLNPRQHRGGGVDATPWVFFWNTFFVYRSNIIVFYVAFRLSVLRHPWKFQDPDPLTFDLLDVITGVMSGGKCVPWHITCKHSRFC